MPEAAFMRARMASQLFAQQVRCLLVFFFLSDSVERQQKFAFVDIVDIVIVKPVSLERAIVVHEAIDAVLDKREVFSIGGIEPHVFDAFEQHTLFVTPFLRLCWIRFP